MFNPFDSDIKIISHIAANFGVMYFKNSNFTGGPNPLNV